MSVKIVTRDVMYVGQTKYVLNVQQVKTGKMMARVAANA